jgi:hypothetical protein
MAESKPSPSEHDKLSLRTHMDNMTGALLPEALRELTSRLMTTCAAELEASLKDDLEKDRFGDLVGAHLAVPANPRTVQACQCSHEWKRLSAVPDDPFPDALKELVSGTKDAWREVPCRTWRCVPRCWGPGRGLSK